MSSEAIFVAGNPKIASELLYTLSPYGRMDSADNR